MVPSWLPKGSEGGFCAADPAEEGRCGVSRGGRLRYVLDAGGQHVTDGLVDRTPTWSPPR